MHPAGENWGDSHITRTLYYPIDLTRGQAYLLACKNRPLDLVSEVRIMETLLSPNHLFALWTTAYEWLRNDVLKLDNALQFAIVVATFGAALLISRRSGVWVDRHRASSGAGRAWQIVVPLVLPVAWLLSLWLALSIGTTLARPRLVIRTSATLLVAWIAIHLVSRAVKNPVWARLITWTAWSIVALSIVGLLEPTIASLDSVALQIG